ncbi:MAG TPA: lipid-binding SYLF domain-containing protein [Xanthomonadales bacterium]|nr:lipid-binding SYLF domain-containing protein [Xanthomonadales bacterium]
MRRIAYVFALAAAFAGSVQAGQDEEQKAREAVRVLDEIMQAPDRRLPDSLLRDAEAVAVIPDVVKAGLVVGGRHGRGLLSLRGRDGTWSNPTWIAITGGSVGLQAGVQSTDVVLVFRTRRGVDGIVNGKFTLGADASVAAGPVGRNANSSTDAQLKAEIYSYSRSRGLFAGIALDGAVLSIDHDANAAVYGRDTTARMIFEGRVAGAPDAVVEFRDRLEEYTAE